MPPQYYPPDDNEFMSGALVRCAPSAAPAVACRAPDRRIASLTASGELPPGLPAQVTFVAAHHCAGCGYPRSHAYHKVNPLIPGQVAPAGFCRKCEKKIQAGKPIDSIVMLIRDFGSGSDAEGKRRGREPTRHRSRSRTRVIIRYQSEDRTATTGLECRDESPEPPKRSISFRHVPSRSVSRAPASRQHKEPPNEPSPATIRRWSSPPRHSGCMIEHGRSSNAPLPPPYRAQFSKKEEDRKIVQQQHDRVDVHVENHVHFDPEHDRRASGTRLPARKGVEQRREQPRVPLSLETVSKRTYYRRTVSKEEERENIPPTSRLPSFDRFVQEIFKGKGTFY
jgi:hypothetical protein